MNADLELQLLGSTSIQNEMIGEIPFRSDRERALLVFLVIEQERIVPREQLAALLWPETGESQARNNLRVSLHRTRQALESTTKFKWIDTRENGLTFSKQGNLYVDTWFFEHALDSVEKHQHENLAECEPCLGELETAVSLYHGDFLQGFNLGDSQPFSEWVTLKRETFHRLAIQAIYTLAGLEIQARNFGPAEAHARQQLEMEPWREEAHRQLILVLALKGERSAAIAQYQQCETILAREFGARPSDETLTLYEQIRAGDIQYENAQSSLPSSPGKQPSGNFINPRFGLSINRNSVLAVVVGLLSLLLVVLFALRQAGIAQNPTPTDATSQAETDIYDNFDNPAFEGQFDDSRWVSVSDPGSTTCSFEQQDGVLFNRSHQGIGNSGCTLRMSRPVQIKGELLDNLEFRSRVSPEAQGLGSGALLGVRAFFEGEAWMAHCGVLTGSEEPSIGFVVADTRLGLDNSVNQLHLSEWPIRYDVWVQVELLTAQNPMELSCWVNGEQIGVYRPENQRELLQAAFVREIIAWRDQPGAVTIEFDDIQLISPRP